VRIDSDLVFQRIQSLVHDGRTIAAKMNAVIDACEAAVPHLGWRDLRALPYDAESTHVRSWISEVLRNEPPPFTIRGIWFGIGNYLIDGRETADMHIVASAAYDATDVDQNWAVYAEYRPEHGEAESRILDSIYDIAYRVHPELENEAEWSLCLAYAAFAIAQMLRTETPAFFGAADDIGVVVGFDEGDSLTIGSLTSHGLTPAG
jgi:hypothetical protein